MINFIIKNSKKYHESTKILNHEMVYRDVASGVFNISFTAHSSLFTIHFF
jgi:hypothetical protein